MREGPCVAEVMRDQVVAARERARFPEIVAAMRRFHISSMPVIDSADRVIGLISNYDLLLVDDARSGTAGLNGSRGRPVRPGHRLLGRFFGRAGRSDVATLLATELMSTPPITVTAATPAREAARAMYRYRVHQLPVVDPVTGRLTGIVARSDLLAIYERPDEEIRREILHGIIENTLGLPPERFEVTAVGGTVTIGGRLERRSDALRLAEAVAHVDGVITVIDHLTYQLDDTVTRSPHAPL